MAMVPDSEWDDERAISDSASTRLIPRHMHALAYYTAAIGLRERSHVPIIGPSLDKRMLNILTKLCNSDTIHSLICASCAQIYTSVDTWAQLFSEELHTWRSHFSPWSIKYHKVSCSLLKMMKESPETFGKCFELQQFFQRYARDNHEDGNPFVMRDDLSSDSWEWKRKFREGYKDCEILCCPEETTQRSYLC